MAEQVRDVRRGKHAFLPKSVIIICKIFSYLEITTSKFDFILYGKNIKIC